MLSRLFFRLLPIQVLIVAMGSINSIVDGIVAARYIDAESLGVVGLYFTMVRILEAVGGVLLGGTAVLCGRAMGSGDLEKTRGIFSLNLTVTFLAGALISAVSFLFPAKVASALGAGAELKEALMVYAVGYAIGIIPQLLAQQLAFFLQLERQSLRGYIGIAVMILTNVSLDIVFVAILKMGLWGLALATAACNWAYFLVLVLYYLTGRAQLVYRPGQAAWGDLPRLLKIGFPGALLVFCIAARTLVLNRTLLTYAGQDGLAAQSAFNMINGLIIALALGTGAVMRMLTSVFFGEEDRESIRALWRIVYTRVMVLSLVLAAVLCILSGALTGIFFTDRASEVFRLTHQLFLIFSFCVPLVLICVVSTNYAQAAGHDLFVNIVSVFDGFLAAVIPAVLLAPKLGALGVWLANPIGILMTALLAPVYVLVRTRRRPRSFDEWLLLPPDLGTTKHLAFMIRSREEVSKTAETVQAFCKENGIDSRTGFYAGLCLEEMAGNVVEHGFEKDRKAHEVDVRVLLKEDGVLLRMKDDCIPFDPRERYEMTRNKDPYANIGIRLVLGIAEEMNYQNMLGLNILTIRTAKGPNAGN